jgi:hypothetical protein
MKPFAVLYPWVLWLTPVAVAILGWRLAGWLGAIAGVVVGCLAAVLIWAVTYSVTFNRSLDRRIHHVSTLSTEQLCEIASNPLSPDLGFAIAELDRRGTNARPSLQSLLDLITSADGNRRGLGLSLLHALYPSEFEKIPMGSSSADSPEIWRGRVEALGEPS